MSEPWPPDDRREAADRPSGDAPGPEGPWQGGGDQPHGGQPPWGPPAQQSGQPQQPGAWQQSGPAQQPGAWQYGQRQQYGQPPYGSPGYGPPGYGPPGYGARPDGQPTSDDRTLALVGHLLALVAGLLGPLVVYLVKKDESPFVREHAAAQLNVQIVLAVGWVVAAVLALVLVGFLLMPFLLAAQLFYPIYGAVQANRGAPGRLPLVPTMVR